MKENEIILNKIYKLLKLIVILFSATLIVLSIGVSSYINNNKKSETTTESEYNTDYDVSMFKEIKASELKKNTKDLSVVYIGRSTCSWCAAFLPRLWEAQEEYGYKTLYIDIAKIMDFTNNGEILDQKAYNIMINLTGKNYETYVKDNFGATPMILIMKNNKIVGAQTGYSEYEEFKKVLNESGIK